MALLQRDFELLREYIRQECALEISNAKKYLIESRLSPLMHEVEAKDFNEFYNIAKNDKTNKLRDKIVDAITTHETLWFRDKSTWEALHHIILPAIVKNAKEAGRDKINIWSAACSTGQEPYSIAMLIDRMVQKKELKGVTVDSFEILATDVSPHSVASAVTGQYNQLEIDRGLPPAFTGYFHKDGNYHYINDTIKNRVKFKTFNLQDSFVLMDKMDLILCRNVLIYFSTEFKNHLLNKIAEQLNPGGFFLLSATETVISKHEKFSMKSHKSGIYYQLSS